MCTDQIGSSLDTGDVTATTTTCTDLKANMT